MTTESEDDLVEDIQKPKGRRRKHPVLIWLGGALTVLTLIATYIGAANILFTNFKEWISGAPVSAAIAAVDDRASTNEDEDVTIDVLANDLNVADIPSLTININDQGTSGDIEVLSDKRVRYSPAPDFAGEDQFGYSIIERDGTFATAWVTVSIDEVNDPPTSTLRIIRTQYPKDAGILYKLMDSVNDVDGDELQITRLSAMGREDQPIVASKLPQMFEIIMGELSDNERRKLDQYVALPIGKWVLEEVKRGNRTTFVQPLEYSVRDAQGIEVDLVAKVEVVMGPVWDLRFACEPNGNGGPVRATFSLLIDDKLVKEDRERISNMDDWKIFLSEDDLTVADFLGDIKMTATWPAVTSRNTLKCESMIFVKGMGLFELGNLNLRFPRNVGRTEANLLNAAALTWYLEGAIGNYEEILQREFDF